jgi:hypothetical protein
MEESMMNLGTTLKCEFMKQRKKRNYLVLLAVLIFYAAYLIWTQQGQSFNYLHFWEATFYDLSLLNKLVLPTAIGVYASMITDLEHKGHTFKLLETLTTRRKLLTAKFIYGSIYITAFVLLQLLVVFVTGAGECGVPSIHDISRYTADTLLVSLILLLLHMELSLYFVNQAVTIIVGVAGSFMGFFLLFMQDHLLYLTNPWSLYAATGFILMDWDPDTRVIRYYHGEVVPHAQIAALVWLSILVLTAIFLNHHSEEEQLHIRSLRTSQKKSEGAERSITFSRLPVEFIKLRRSPIWVAFLALPVISALLGTINYVANIDVLESKWYSLWSQHSLFLALLFMPLLIAAFCSFQWHLEHTGTNWNMVMTATTPVRLVIGKITTAVIFTVITVFWIVVLYILSGLIIHIDAPIPHELPEWIICGIIGGITCCCVQTLLSIVIRNSALPIGIAIMSSLSVFILANKIKWLIYLDPHTLLSLGLRANNPEMVINIGYFLLSCFLWSMMSIIISILYLRKTDITTH